LAPSIGAGVPLGGVAAAEERRVRQLVCDRSSARTSVVCLGLSVDAPGFHPARPPPQTELPFADEARDFVADAPAPEDFGA
jgi:hypothetical protein